MSVPVSSVYLPIFLSAGPWAVGPAAAGAGARAAARAGSRGLFVQRSSDCGQGRENSKSEKELRFLFVLLSLHTARITPQRQNAQSLCHQSAFGVRKGQKSHLGGM